MSILLAVSVTALCAGALQGITGFGAGIVMMLLLPQIFPLIQAAGISSAINITLCLGIILRYRKHINYKKVVIPAALYLTTSGTTIYFSTMLHSEVLKKIFGIFLIVLSLYYLFYNPKKKNLSLFSSVCYIVISGICNGLFGIGGPLMVLFYLSQTDSKEEYFGTLQMVFFINLVYTTTLRTVNHILTIEHVPYIIIGTIFTLVGLFLANKIVNLLDAEKIKKFTYVVIGVSGILNLI